MSIKNILSIRNINDLRRSIGRSVIISFLILGSLSSSILFIMQMQYKNKMRAWDQQQIENAITIYQSNLSEKISMIANSTTFVDFLRSGSKTRKLLLPDLRYELSNVNLKNIAGMDITDQEGLFVFEQGQKTSNQAKLTLCYLNRTLNNMGQCNFYWTFYFTKNNLLSALSNINPHIQYCDSCQSVNFLKNSKFGSFLIEEASPLLLKIHVTESNENIIYFYSILMLSVLVIFTIWNRYRVKSIVNRHIADPIEKITNGLIAGQTSMPDQSDLEEIQYLMEQLNYWKIEVKTAEGEKHEAAIGRLASQVAHDIRSPLTALDIVINHTKNLAEENRILIRNAVLRINDIANNLLGQYKHKNPAVISSNNNLSPELIADILLTVISEKRIQLNNSTVQFIVDIQDDAYGIFANVIASEFQRALSNLIQNAVEAITGQGHVTITMDRKDQMINLRIHDTGCGIPANLLPKILEGKLSVGKQGAGLGLARAKNTIESWGGKFIIQSDINGTSINIQLSIAKPAPWFMPTLLIKPKSTIIVLDDDSSIYVVWNDRLKQYLQKKQISLIKFDHPDQLIQWHKPPIDEQVLYLIDYEFNNSSLNGLSIIKQLNIHTQSYLVTSHHENTSVQQHCYELKVTIIPKSYAPYIPIEATSESGIPKL